MSKSNRIAYFLYKTFKNSVYNNKYNDEIYADSFVYISAVKLLIYIFFLV